MKVRATIDFDFVGAVVVGGRVSDAELERMSRNVVDDFVTGFTTIVGAFNSVTTEYDVSVIKEEGGKEVGRDE